MFKGQGVPLWEHLRSGGPFQGRPRLAGPVYLDGLAGARSWILSSVFDGFG